MSRVTSSHTALSKGTVWASQSQDQAFLVALLRDLGTWLEVSYSSTLVNSQRLALKDKVGGGEQGVGGENGKSVAAA
jgi:hypothetical protein